MGALGGSQEGGGGGEEEPGGRLARGSQELPCDALLGFLASETIRGSGDGDVVQGDGGLYYKAKGGGGTWGPPGLSGTHCH